MKFKSVVLGMLVYKSERGGVRSNKLYTLVSDDSAGDTVMVKPTVYFHSLNPCEAIAQLKAHVEDLFQKLRLYTEVNEEASKDLEEAHQLLYEVEVAQQFLVHIRQGLAKKGLWVK
ncbi:MAG: hypothetical protein SWH78_00120 [Thermodesulfobacteriota bacterium]|nr:hypothetical protein [Thermodesulfobacteriota bacterium]